MDHKLRPHYKKATARREKIRNVGADRVKSLRQPAARGKQTNRERVASSSPGYTQGDSAGYLEVARTLDIIDQLVRSDDDRESVQVIADELAAVTFELLTEYANDPSARLIRKQMSNHVWCDILASLALVLRKANELVDETVARLAGGTADAAAEAVTQAATAIATAVLDLASLSRESDHGQTPHRAGTDTSRAEQDEQSSVTRTILTYLIRKFIERLLTMWITAVVTGGMPFDLAATLRCVRMLAALICPDAYAHRLVWDECLIPLLEELIPSDTRLEWIAQLPNLVLNGPGEPPSGGLIAKQDAILYELAKALPAL